MIGRVELSDVLGTARSLASVGGPDVPLAPGSLGDFAPTGPSEIYAATRSAAAHSGGVLMSSGGTTAAPKLTYIPHDMGLDRLVRSWNPLTDDAVLLNLFAPGRMWGSHYYMQQLAQLSRCTVIPSGPYSRETVSDWLPTLRRCDIDALAGTPTGLADFAAGVLAAGDVMPIKVIIWMGEPWTAAKRATVRAAFPAARWFGNYGSVETWVIATNLPECEHAVLHLLPDQVLEPDPDGALLTRVGPGWAVPTVRYRLGDRVEPAQCRCGRPDGLRVTGRADDAISLRSALFPAHELLATVCGVPEVSEAQLVLTRAGDSSSSASAMNILYTGTADPAEVRTRLIAAWIHLQAIDRQYPEAVTVQASDTLQRIARTTKTPAVIWRSAA